MPTFSGIFTDVIRASVALFVVLDPIGLVPVFLGLTRNLPTPERQRTLRVVTYTASSLLIGFALVGQQLLLLFGISLHSFMIAGGILLLILSIEMLTRGGPADKFGSSEEIGVVPMAFPLLVGPGAITTTMITLQTSGIMVVLLSIVIVMVVTSLIFRLTDQIHRLLRETGSAVITRVMAIFIAAIAVQFILNGIQFYYPPR